MSVKHSRWNPRRWYWHRLRMWEFRVGYPMIIGALGVSLITNLGNAWVRCPISLAVYAAGFAILDHGIRRDRVRILEAKRAAAGLPS